MMLVSDSASINLHDLEEFPLFTVYEITDQEMLIKRLIEQSDPVSAFLWKSLSKREQLLLKAFEAENMFPHEVHTLHIIHSALNKVIVERNLCQSERFEGVPLRPETTDLLKQSPTGYNRRYLNRLLLEDTYRLELRRCRQYCLFTQLVKHFPSLEIQGYFSDDYGWAVLRMGGNSSNVSSRPTMSRNPALIPLFQFPVVGFDSSSVLQLLTSGNDVEWNKFVQELSKKKWPSRGFKRTKDGSKMYFFMNWAEALIFKVGMQMLVHQSHNLTAIALRRLLEILKFYTCHLGMIWVKGFGKDELEFESFICAVARFGRIADLKLLIEAGVRIGTSDQMPLALHAAIRQGKLANARLLIKAGAVFAAQGDEGNTSLHYAAISGNPNVIRLLLRVGHPTDTRNYEGFLPVDLAPKSCRKLFARQRPKPVM